MQQLELALMPKAMQQGRENENFESHLYLVGHVHRCPVKCRFWVLRLATAQLEVHQLVTARLEVALILTKFSGVRLIWAVLALYLTVL